MSKLLPRPERGSVFVPPNTRTSPAALEVRKEQKSSPAWGILAESLDEAKASAREEKRGLPASELSHVHGGKEHVPGRAAVLSPSPSLGGLVRLSSPRQGESGAPEAWASLGETSPVSPGSRVPAAQ